MEDQTNAMTGIRAEIRELREQMDRHFEMMDARIVALDQKFDQRLAALDQKIDRPFTWLIGTQVAVLVAVVGALVGSYYR